MELDNFRSPLSLIPISLSSNLFDKSNLRGEKLQEMKTKHSGVAQSPNWISIVIYYALACAISFPFFWWRDMQRESWLAWKMPNELKPLFHGWGPGLSALIVLVLFRRTHKRTITLFGTSKARSLLIYLVPVVGLSVIGFPNRRGYDPHLYGLLLGVIVSIYALGEELGWRGFLQDALRPLTPPKR